MTLIRVTTSRVWGSKSKSWTVEAKRIRRRKPSMSIMMKKPTKQKR